MSCTAKAKVTLEITFDLSQPWSHEESIGNMQQRAHRDAREMAERVARRITAGYGEDDPKPAPLPYSARVVTVGNEVTLVLPEPGR